MAIKDFELFHGAVLTKLVRSDKPITLRMIETNVEEAWSAYTLNDEAILYLKYSSSPQKKLNMLTWSFAFTNKQIDELIKLNKKRQLFVSLVCADKDMKSKNMYAVILYPNEISKCINISLSHPQSVWVRFEPRKNLRVWGTANTFQNPIKIPQSRIDNWTIPGS